MAIKVANAPVNFGIYRTDEAPLGPDALLYALAEAGYDGVDSGPIGYLGTGAALGERLARTGMGLAGGWIDLRYDDAEGFAADLAGLETALAVFSGAAVSSGTAASPGTAVLSGAAMPSGVPVSSGTPADDPRFAPRPTLACPAHPARFASGAAPGLPAGEWAAFAGRIQRAADRCRQAGLEPVFHHHLGTLVETPEEVERVLDLTDVSLCLDTGHLWLAGGDPVAAARRWGGRIGQLHLKDADREVLDRVRRAGGDLAAAVAAGAFTPLGRGDVDLPGVLRELGGYEGWLVVEQDAPASGQDIGRILDDQRANRAWLRAHGI
ncbi:sugar phosphate isomerase/epimerase family protein [Planomonospora venezuelensis]|uniref:Inosose dehydratase n=1 Tax=Planomonospora venezuelensis TaxID=1999 RepID=A0A841D080_PLAVE|nr:sugar phosphate isomerase/epimerase [Planomonospora venezuelensis]MBB5961595.1 inosose dehydratase [Planomonospora venezuelensis]GIM98741.1 inosose dehydratase [Planomonospora venezuelensis]